MKLNKSEFKGAVARISNAIPKKAIIQNLCNVLFESKDGVIKLTGSDVSHICYTTFKAEGVEDVSFTVNCEKLKKALAMRGNEITLTYHEAPNEHISISNGVTSVDLECLPVYDYPAFNKPTASHIRKISAKKFVEIVNKVKFAACRDNSRKALQGVYVNFTKDEMQIFCTDGKRIAYCSEPCAELLDNDTFGFNLPMKSIEIINNLNVTATQNEDKTWIEPEVTINASETTVEFIQDDFATTTKVITEKPPVDSILGMINGGTVFTEASSSFTVESVNIAESLKFINSLCEPSSGVKISRKENKVHFSVKNGTQNIDDEIEIENIKDGEIEINCNIQYLMEPIASFSVEKVAFEMSEPLKPFFIMANNYKYLLMPLRTN